MNHKFHHSCFITIALYNWMSPILLSILKDKFFLFILLLIQDHIYSFEQLQQLHQRCLSWTKQCPQLSSSYVLQLHTFPEEWKSSSHQLLIILTRSQFTYFPVCSHQCYTLDWSIISPDTFIWESILEHKDLMLEISIFQYWSAHHQFHRA